VFSLALTKSGKVFAWGSNKNGQMGSLELTDLEENAEDSPIRDVMNNNEIP